MTNLRALRPSDLPQLPQLLTVLDREPIPWDASWLVHKIFEDPDFDPALSPVLEDNGRLVALAHGVIRHYEARHGGTAAFLKLMAVDPAYQRQGLMSRLLDQFEAQVKSAGVEKIKIDFCPPAFLIPAVDPGYTAALSLLLRRGYKSSRQSYVNMSVPLDLQLLETAVEEERLHALGYHIRRAEGKDKKAAAQLGYALGGNFWRSEIVDAFHYDPVRLHLALRNGRPVAFAAQDVSGPTLFGPTATEPSARKQGIGTVLLKRCLRDVLAQGHSEAIICGAGPIAYYISAVGATVCRTFWPFVKDL